MGDSPNCRQVEERADWVQRQLVGLNAALAAFAGVYSNQEARPLGVKRKRTPDECQGTGSLRRAQKARWAKVRAAKK